VRRPPDHDDREDRGRLNPIRSAQAVRPALALLVLLLAACGGTGSALSGIREVERPLPPLAGETVDGGRLEEADLAGKVVLVNVWATWCGPCRTEQPMLQRLWERYRDRGVAFVGIDWRDDRAAARDWIRAFGVTYPSLWDPSGSWADDLGWIGAPTTYLADRGGTIRYVIEGAIGDRYAVQEEDLVRLLEELLAEG